MQSAIDATLSYIPEIILCGVIVLLILGDLFGANKLVFFIAIAGLIAHLFFLNADVLKMTMTLAALVTVAISPKQRVEYYLFIFSILLGANVLVTSSNFIMILLSMETISLSSYVLTAGTGPNKRRAEAAWKFFIYGSVATAVMIFGMSYYYGVTGNISFTEGSQRTILITIGGIMILAGLLFKMTAVPFHLWAPDVYEATPVAVLAFLSVVPKLAAIGVVIKIGASLGFSDIIAAAAMLSIVVGTLAALSQTDARRMMAYSSVAHAGFMLAAVSVGAMPPLIFYVIVFAIMNYAAFIVIGIRKETAFTEFAGMGYTSPLAATAGTLALVSLVGIPPAAGFMGKLFVFTAIWAKYGASGQLLFAALFVVGLLATVVSLFFYLKIPFYMFFRRGKEKQSIKISFLSNLLLVILVGLLLALFIAPGLLMG